jgi:hypothetical protein
VHGYTRLRSSDGKHNPNPGRVPPHDSSGV